MFDFSVVHRLSKTQKSTELLYNLHSKNVSTGTIIEDLWLIRSEALYSVNKTTYVND